MPRTRSKGASPPHVDGGRYGESYVVEYTSPIWPCAGVYPSYDTAIDAIKTTLAESAKLANKCWTNFMIVVHANNTATVGVPDAIRRFKQDGTAYMPTDVHSEELKRANQIN